MATKPLAQDQSTATEFDLGSVTALATAAAHEHVRRMTGRQEGEALTDADERYFTYAWLKALAASLGELHGSIKAICLIPQVEGDDDLVDEVVILAKTNNAALALIAKSVEAQYDRVRGDAGLSRRLCIRHLPDANDALGRSVMNSLCRPPLQVWP